MAGVKYYISFNVVYQANLIFSLFNFEKLPSFSCSMRYELIDKIITFQHNLIDTEEEVTKTRNF